MGKNNLDINTAKLGMDKDSHPSSMGEQSYRHVLNTNYEDSNGNGSVMPQNEASNILCVKFDEGFKVIGVRNDINADRTYFMLTNPTTGVSEIGYVDNNQNVINVEDVESRCGCGIIKSLSLPLEDIVQAATCVYTTMLEDSCNFCLGFSINSPIYEIEIKDEKCGKTLYWAEETNPQRHVNLTKLAEYKQTGSDVCGDDTLADTCVDCDKLRIFKLFDKPCLNPEVVQVGGNLKAGTYEALIAYCDRDGNELSDYYSITLPIPIFDRNNQIIDQPNQDYRTTFGIRIGVEDLDTKFDYYKIVFIQTTGVNREVSQFVEGVHSTSEATVFITNELNKERISIERLTSVKPFYKTARGMASSNGYLFQFGLTAEKELNLQPVVNLMGSLVHWQSTIASSKIYEDGILSSKYRGYMRDETYPLSIRFPRTSGKFTANFPFVGRPVVEGVEDVVVDNTDTQSVSDFNQACVTSNREKRYEFYNTASEIGACAVFAAEYNCFSSERVVACTIVDPVISIASTTYTITDVEDFTNLEDYVATYGADICDIASSKYDAALCALITDTYPETCIPDEIKATALVTVTGASGTANVNINGTNYLMTFTTDIDTSIDNFITSHEATILASEEAFVTNAGSDVLQVEYRNHLSDVTIANVSGDLAGTVVTSGVVDTGADCPVGCEDSGTTPTTQLTLDTTSETLVYNEEAEAGYTLNDAASICIQHEDDGSGNPVPDTTFQTVTGLTPVYTRINNSSLESCSPATTIAKANGLAAPLRLNPYTDPALAPLQDASVVGIVDGSLEFPASPVSFPVIPALAGSQQFTNSLHKGAIWLDYSFDTDETVGILELTRSGTCQEVDALVNTIVRVTAYDSCTSNTPLASTMIDIAAGGLMRLDRTLFAADNIRIAIDAPIAGTGGASPNQYYIDAPCGCFYAYKRPVEYTDVETTVDADVYKSVGYTADCYYKVPKVGGDCDPLPFKYGKFAYVESTETYPDNEELYNSAALDIEEADLAGLSSADLLELKGHYSSNGIGDFTLDTTKTDFRCQPIRHFKFPDNAVSPFMNDEEVDEFINPVIYPLGITIDENAIIAFLDLAVKNELITQEERDSITGYEIFRGDRALDKAIIAKGYLYDMYKYTEEDGGEEVHYPNFPYNDLGENRLSYADEDRTTLVQHPYGSSENSRFTFHSPDTHFIKPSLPSEIKMEGFVYGHSKGKFEQVEDHPKMSILGDIAYTTATALAIAETVAELAIISADLFSDLAALTVGGLPSAVLTGIAIATIISESFIRTGKNRYEWLQTLSDLGTLRNYASYYTSVGYYNKFVAHSEETNLLRGIAASGYLKSGRALIKEEDSGTEVRINNQDRESSVFISTGANASYRFSYPTAYQDYDNSDNINSRNSRVSASDVDGACDVHGKSFTRNIASPYVSLKNYLPSQYGDIGSVRWLATGHCGNLSNITTLASIVVSGTSGDADITICTDSYVIGFDTDIETSIDNFISDEAANILAQSNAVVTKTGADTILIEYSADCSDVTFVNSSGDLAGAVTSQAKACNTIFGGDVFISWMSLKRKTPMFTTDIMGLGDNIPFNYYFYRNIGHTKYYIDYLTTEDDSYSLEGIIFPTIDSVVETDCEDTTLKFYLPSEAKFYLYYYGIPQFLVESTINLNMRHANEETHQMFYPQVGDYVNWTQEKNTPIRRDNTYLYNPIYSKQVTTVATRTLPSNYSKAVYDCTYDQENGIIYSEQDGSEQDLTDPWLVYKPLNNYQFPTSYGKLIALNDIESLQILGRFENQMAVFNAVDKIRDRLTPATKEIGLGGIFATRPLTFNRTTLGYAGTQHRAMISCEYGHFFADAMRGQVFQLAQGGKSLDEVSAFSGQKGEPSGMRNWFKENLPFKILRGGVHGLDQTDTDNAFKGLGITMGWDSRHRRVFLTKKDYQVKEAFRGKLTYTNGVFYNGNNPVELTDTFVFEECSWTVAYSPITRKWMSFYSFKPNYYINHNNYFQTGINYANDDEELGLWSHLLTNRSFQVFYGKKYPWILEMPVKNQFATQILQAFEYNLDTKRYHDERSFAENRRVGFNKAYVYNNSQNSGLLNLITEDPDNMYQQSKYPITNRYSRDILATENEMRWTFNSFYNQVRNELRNVPVWIGEIDGVTTTLNNAALTYRKEEEHLFGDWFMLRLEQDQTSQYKMIFKHMTSLTNIYRR